MKYFAFLSLILVACSSGYWYGYRVGFEEATILKFADAALDGMASITELEYDLAADAQDIHEIQINRALTKYGEYLENSSQAAPIFYSAKPVIDQLFRRVVRYRVDNPRIFNGVEYSPSNKSFKESAEYKQLLPEHRQRLEKEDQYYEQAMENR